jgi:hypothetical protein
MCRFLHEGGILDPTVCFSLAGCVFALVVVLLGGVACDGGVVVSTWV